MAEYSLDSFLEKIVIDSTDTIQVNVCDIIEAKRDSILVIKPYTSVSKQSVLKDLKNHRNIKPGIREIRQTLEYRGQETVISAYPIISDRFCSGCANS